MTDTVGKRLLVFFIAVIAIVIIDVLFYRGAAMLLILIKPVGALLLLPYGLLHFAGINPYVPSQLALLPLRLAVLLALVYVVYVALTCAYLMVKDRKVANAILSVVVILFILNLHGCERMITNYRWGGG